MVRLAFVCLALGACAASPNTDFAELPDLHVDVLLNRQVDRDADAKRPTSVDVYVYYDLTAFDELDSERSCATIEASGTFNGADLELEQQGGYDDFDCSTPYFSTELQLSPADTGHLELRDHHGNMVVADLPAGGVRMATSASGWTFTPGQQVALDWSSSTDLAELKPEDVSLWFNRDGNGFDMKVDSVTASQVIFTVPSPPPTQGDGLIDVIVGQYGASTEVVPATTCSGATKCTLSAIRGYQHSARIELAR
jgi:hypothetical protein